MLTQHKIHYGWVVVGVTFLTLLIGAGVRSAPGVLLVPLETEFAWSRGTISFAIAVSLLLYGFAGPFSASFMERFGIRRTMLAADTARFALSIPIIAPVCAGTVSSHVSPSPTVIDSPVKTIAGRSGSTA